MNISIRRMAAARLERAAATKETMDVGSSHCSPPVLHRGHHVVGFLAKEARVALGVLRRHYERYTLLQSIRGSGFHVDRTAIVDRDQTGTIIMGQRVSVGRYVYLCAEDHGTLVLEDDVYIGEFNNIRAASGNITIGADTMIAQFVSIVAANHRIPPQGISIQRAGYDRERRNVRIGRGVWIGANVVILPGVEIGDEAVIGAGAVVTRSIPPAAIAVGSPARVVRTR